MVVLNDWRNLKVLHYQLTIKFLVGVVINETLSWADHIDYVQKKVSNRLGVLKRIKHLLPIHTRKLVVNCLFLPLLYYGDLVWGDRNNITLMNHLQMLHNKAAKCVLDMPSYASSTEAWDSLNWCPLSSRRRFHRWSFVFNALNNEVDFSYNK